MEGIMTVHDASLEAYQAEKKAETFTQTIICELETSGKKTTRVRECIEEWQAIASGMADLMPTFPAYKWGEKSQQTQLSRMVRREFPDHSLRKHDAYQAAYKVAEAFESWRENGMEGDDNPKGRFGDGPYMRICNCGGSGFALRENDRHDGFGLKVGLQPYKPEWFHLRAPQDSYQREKLGGVLNEETYPRIGASEIRVSDDGRVFAHLSVVDEVDVYVADSVERWMGVDPGMDVLYALAIIGARSGTIEQVEVESGREYLHYRERLKSKLRKLSQRGDRRGVKKCRGDIERYTEHILHEASRQIVDLAVDNAPCGIRVEDLTGLREQQDNHDWPYAQFQEYILYKADAAGVPVEKVNADGTSKDCNRCGQEGIRDSREFTCRRCDYQVHADVNAAINIAHGSES